jgi:hypothetical protein
VISNIEEALSVAVKLGAKILLHRTDAGDGKSFFATIQDRAETLLDFGPKFDCLVFFVSANFLAQRLDSE